MSAPHRLERSTFDISRSGEYLSVKELQIQTGQHVGRFGDVAIKELVDNGLDAAEEDNVVPDIDVEVVWRADGAARVSVHDNGAGLPDDVVGRVLNFDTRTSNKALYRSPTRGALGNALKTIIGMPAALGCHEPVVITACGVRHSIMLRTDPAGRVHVDHERLDVEAGGGTTIEVVLPAEAWTSSRPLMVCQSVAAFNPHAFVHLRSDAKAMSSIIDDRASRAILFTPVVSLSNGWRKWLPTDPTSPWWYDAQSFEKLVYGYIARAQNGERDVPLGTFVREFRGCKRTEVARAVCEQAALAGIAHLSDLDGRSFLIAELWRALRRATGTAPKADVLGLLGKDALRARLAGDGTGEQFWYERSLWLTSEGVPWAAEVAIAVRPDWSQSLQCFGLNFSVALDDPLAGVDLVPEQQRVMWESIGLSDLLVSVHVVGNHAPFITATVVHLVSAAMDHKDRGKAHLHVDDDSATRIATMVTRAARVIAKEGEKKRARSYGGSVRESRPRESDGVMTFKEAFPLVIDEAYAEAIGSMSTVEARTTAYAVRPRLQALCPGRPMGRKFLDYIGQTLIPNYKQQHPDALPGIIYEPRGRLIEPHTHVVVRLGTRDVARYIIPEHTYNKILIIEKKGRVPVVLEARLAEKYDMAIADTEGYATVAARDLLARCSKEENCQIFVVHDADWHGYGIARALREETRRMRGYHVEVIDLGLFYEQAVLPVAQGGYGLQTEARDRVYDLPANLHLSDIERKAFTGVPTNRVDKAKRRIWEAHCVEINAFPNDALIAFIEDGLQREGAVGKVVPPGDVLVEHYTDAWTDARREQIKERILAKAEQRIEDELERRRAKAGLDDPALPDTLAEQVHAAFEDDPYTDWRTALRDQAEEGLDDEEQDDEEQDDDDDDDDQKRPAP